MNDGKIFMPFMLGIDIHPEVNIPRVVLSALTIPFAYNISYADILDGSMKAIRRITATAG